MLNNGNCIFSLNANGFLCARIDGEDVGRVKIVCSLPLTLPDRYLCVMNLKDEELGIIDSTDDFSGEQKEIIAKEIATRYFCPVIEQIASVKDKMGNFYFDVTISGRNKNFLVRDITKNIRQRGKSVTITDCDGNRYLIEDIDTINRKSRRKLEPYLY